MFAISFENHSGETEVNLQGVRQGRQSIKYKHISRISAYWMIFFIFFCSFNIFLNTHVRSGNFNEISRTWNFRKLFFLLNQLLHAYSINKHFGDEREVLQFQK